MRVTLIISVLLIFHLSVNAQKDFYSARWSEVYKNEVKDLPKSALEIVDTIYYKAKKDKNITEITKALLYHSKFVLTLQENAELVVVEKFKKEIDDSQAPLKNVLESMLAQIYWQYFQANRWKYYNRTTASEAANAADFRTWDAVAILKEIDQHFQRSLSNTTLLRNTRLEAFDDILALAEHSKRYRPTLYDFLANYALDFYAADESALQDPAAERTFEFGNYFIPIDTINFNDSSIKSGKYEALKLFQTLLLFHKERRDTSASVNLEIERLKFVEEHSTQSEETKLFENALINLKRLYNRHPASTLLDLELASISFKKGSNYHSGDTTQRWEKKSALRICNNAIARFPGSDGAKRCEALREHILARQLSLKAEKFLPVTKQSRMLVTYTNLASIHLRIYEVPTDFEEPFFRDMNDSSRAAMLNGKAVKASWQSELPKTDDYQNHSTELVVPALAQGTYLIVASERNDFFANDAIFAFTSVGVTNLALLEVSSNTLHRFQVVDRNNGRPIPGADVHLRSIDFKTDADVIDVHETTNKDGFVELDKPTDRGWTLEVTVAFEGDTVLFRHYYYYNYRNSNRERKDDVTAKAFLFTDRSIYRPGQTICFKGIFIKTNNKTSSIVAGEYVEIFLEDANSEDIASLRLKTNSYGSFSGEFRLPSSGLTGEYRLYADEDSEGDSRFYDNLRNFDYSETTISVEEYKRPTFEVSMESLAGTFKLNDTIKVSGNAVAYSGSKVSKAKVAYTVKREVRYPLWYYWEFNNDYSEPEEISNGEVGTNEQGEFIIPFKAIANIKIAGDSKPVFSFSISVDVTDINGETRSSSSLVNVGYHSMVATVKVPSQIDLQKPFANLTIITENLNGQFLPAKGNVKVYKLQGPANPVRKRPWPAPDYPIISKNEFETLFPNESFGDDVSSPTEWDKGKLVKEILFDTKKSKEATLTLDKTWNIGSYVMELQTTDSVGQPVEDKVIFEVVDSKGNGVPDNALLIFQSDKNSYKPGEVAKIKVGSAYTAAHVTIEVEKNNKVVKTWIEKLSAGTKELTVPITDVGEGGFSIHCSAAIFNGFLEQHKTIRVESDLKRLSIETETFKDKLQPGSKEQWSFTIAGQEGEKLEAEILASMYDASLDQFKSHDWNFTPIQQPYYYSGYRISSDQSFGEVNFIVKNLPRYRLEIPQQNYDGLDWFGFSLTNRDYAKRRYLERLYFDATSTGKASKVTMSHNRNGRQGFISGRLTAGDGEALPGVNIIVKGTTRGTVTDIDGYYSIEAGKDDVLVFSFVGFVSTEVKAARKNVINVSMEPDIMQLSEVVVVGYGVQQKKDLTASVATVYSDTTASDEIVFEEALQGKVAGLQISVPGGTFNFNIRGNATLTAENQPLYVVDGVIVESSKIDQNDLASAQVLKGSAATALYGSSAINGVIIITTKSGQQKIDNELAKVNARKNFNETAFFFPHLTTDENGRIRFSFTTPESLTRWKLQLLAHTKDLITTTKTLQAVTQKEMMITPNLPRFVRVGDEVIISAKISNLSRKKLDGRITLQLANPENGQSVDQLFTNIARNQTFKTDARGNTQVSWSIKVPPGIDVVQYKIVGKAGSFSDGEQNILPVLQNRMLVTETMPLYVRSKQTKTFSLAKLQNQSSPTLQHHQLTLEITSNPAWYAVQSLPYLMEFPHECAEQLFSRFYANSIASHVVNSNPKIKEVFEKWSDSGKLTSTLENNQELKSIIIEETPWVRDAETETERKKRIAMLFDLNLMSDQLTATVGKLKDMQFSNGGFPWFTGGRYSDRYITQHVASGFGHLGKLKITLNDDMKGMMAKAVKYLDDKVVEDYNEIIKDAESSSTLGKGDQKQKVIANYLDTYSPSNIDVHYLYMRSFYPDIVPDAKAKEAIKFLQNQTDKKWLDFNLLQKGMVALIQYRLGNKALANDILASLKENSIISDELGMYWKENVGGWYWHQAEVETQALIIEAFAEIEKDNPKLNDQEKQSTIDELRIWLLKNKQTNSWRTTKATTEAAYALLLNGSDWLSLESSVNATVGTNEVNVATKGPEVGTGYMKTSWKGDDVKSEMANITISKKDEGIAWGGLYWQYFEDLDRITKAETPLKLKKNVYKVVNTDKGEKLNEIKNEVLKPGDLIRIRIELTADRAMEYLHMKDMRAAGFEPVDVLSEYKWQEGLGYYQSTRDVATNFFFDRVPKGVYVFEYDLRVNVKGKFSNGITTIQSMYAPEFSSHSEGIRVVVE
ncbi:MAG: MG2 domain-containing protein [Chryseosolibacter sp.]